MVRQVQARVSEDAGARVADRPPHLYHPGLEASLEQDLGFRF